MARAPLLLLIGLRCSGKTTLGASTAKEVGCTFRDLDSDALALLGCGSVTDAFERHGEAGWRAAEGQALRRALESGIAGVLAVGGGTPTAPGAAELIRGAQSDGWMRVALLHPGLDTLARRLGVARGDRPRLAGDDASEVARLAAERLPLYRSMADVTVDTRMPSEHCVQRLNALLTGGHWPFPLPAASE